MGGEILLRGHDLVERVDEARVSDFAAFRGTELPALRVAAVPGIERAVVVLQHVGIAEFERRDIGLVQLRQGEDRALRNERILRREPPAAEMRVEQLVYGIERAAHVGTGQNEGLPDGRLRSARPDGHSRRRRSLSELWLPCQTQRENSPR